MPPTTDPPTRHEVDHWIRPDPQTPRCVVGDDADAFRRIRTHILSRLMHQPGMGYRQLLNSLGGCCWYLGLLFVGLPHVEFWATLLADPNAHGMPHKVRPEWLPSPAPDVAPPYLTTIILWLAGVALI